MKPVSEPAGLGARWWVRGPVAVVAGVLVAALSVFASAAPEAPVVAGFAIGFYGCLLTGASVLFAVAVSGGDRWPSMAQVARHALFLEWIALGGVATAVGVVGALVRWDALWVAVMLVLAVADALGMVSFLRLLGIANVVGKNRLLARELAAALRGAPHGDEHTVRAYRSTLDHALSEGRGRDADALVEQLLDVDGKTAAWRELHFAVLRSTTRSTLLGGADPVVTSALLTRLVSAAVEDPSQGDVRVAHLARTSRLLAWTASSALVLATREALAMATARQLVQAALDGRDEIRATMDPSRRGASDGSRITPVQALYWYRDACSFQGSHLGSASYGLYENLTGRRFNGNYFDGDPVLGELLDTDPLSIPGTADRAQAEDVLAAVAIEALSGFRAQGWGHPPALEYPDFDPEPRLLAAYLGVFAGIGGVSTPESAAASVLRSLEPPTGEFADFCKRWDPKFDMGGATRTVSGVDRLGSAVLVGALRLAHDHEYDPQPVARFVEHVGPVASRAATLMATHVLGGSPGPEDPQSSPSRVVEMALLPSRLRGHRVGA